MSISQLIVGLGNPGKKYATTRHNLGFLVLRSLADRYLIKLSKKILLKGFWGEGLVESKRTYLLMPLTYMNNSGVVVKNVVRKKGCSPFEMLVLSDDIHLAFGDLRLRPSGSSGGHHGLNSVIQHLGTDGFARLRMGVGSPRGGEDTAAYVLSEFTLQEKKQLGDFIERAVKCCVAWLTKGNQEAMSQFNKRKENEQV